MSNEKNKINKGVEQIADLAKKLSEAKLTEDESGKIEGGFTSFSEDQSKEDIVVNFYQCK